MMARLAREGILGSLSKVHLSICEPYMIVKATGKPFDKIKMTASVLEVVHCDICTPMNLMA